MQCTVNTTHEGGLIQLAFGRYHFDDAEPKLSYMYDSVHVNELMNAAAKAFSHCEHLLPVREPLI